MPELIPAVPGAPEWLAALDPVKLSPWSRIGMIHGAYAVAYPGGRDIAAHAYDYPVLAGSSQYRRGFVRTALIAGGIDA